MLTRRQWTPLPSFYCRDQQPAEPDTWTGKLQRMDELLGQCSPPTTWQLFKNQRQGDECFCPTSCKDWLKEQDVYTLKIKGKYTSTSKSINRGYIQVEPGAWDSNDTSFYLHTFICYAFHGPHPPHLVNPCAAHTCNHRLCLNPWHIRWVSKSVDKQEDWDHRKRQRR